MARAANHPASPDRKKVDIEIARLRDLDVGGLRARWHTVFRRRAPSHIPRHLLYRILAYRLQADRFGDLDAETLRLLDRSGSSTDVGRLAAEFNKRRIDLRAGTVLVREWNGQLERVTVHADGFTWKNKIYPSLTKVAFALTGTRWNGPRFFGLRDKPSTEGQP
jgi:Protein of unknown function (DUF2924)